MVKSMIHILWNSGDLFNEWRIYLQTFRRGNTPMENLSRPGGRYRVVTLPYTLLFLLRIIVSAAGSLCQHAYPTPSYVRMHDNYWIRQELSHFSSCGLPKGRRYQGGTLGATATTYLSYPLPVIAPLNSYLSQNSHYVGRCESWPNNHLIMRGPDTAHGSACVISAR